MSLRSAAVVLLLLASVALACADSKSSSGGAADAGPTDAIALADASVAGDAEPAMDAAPAACAPAGSEVVTFMTDDQVELEADLYLTGEADRPLVVLLHMIPPTNNRTNYPSAFIDEFITVADASRRTNVLNLDRRGAGGSGGVAAEAYQGPKGALDVKAAVEFFRSHACGRNTSLLGLVGASNGSTSVLDYTILAAGDPALLDPVVMVFLTGGTYTEAQTQISDQRTVLDAIALRFVFSTAERAWSAQFFPAATAVGWSTFEYPNGGHGTRMFTSAPESIHAVAGDMIDLLNP